jgi:hemolysin activation/secretion protein
MSAFAQPVLQTPRERFELRQPKLGEEPPPELVLPPIPPPPGRAPEAAGERVRVEAFRFEGNTVFSDAELTAVVAPWTGREITSAELRAARDAVTRHYIDAGYVSSGAVLPDQQMQKGVVLVQVVEGRLARVDVEGARWHRPSYFESRLIAAAGTPVRVQDLERRLEVFQQDPSLTRIAARLEPSEQRGETALRLAVDEAFPLRLGLEWSNDVPPSLGDQAGRIDASLPGPLLLGDELSGDVRFAEGLVDTEGRYAVPLNHYDTELEARVRWSDGKVVEHPFEHEGFISDIFTAGVGVLQPVWRTEQDEVRVALLGEWRRSHTDIEEVPGEGIAFPGTGANSNGLSTLSVLRLGGEWVRRSRERVFALRQLISVGVPVLGASHNPPGQPDWNFTSFLTQVRHAERFPHLLGLELVLRGDLQLATEPLMPMEQIGVGGVDSVRGYRVNQLVRDQAAVGSVELRLPVYRDDERGHLVQLAPFFDAGYGWSAGPRESEGQSGAPDNKAAFGSDTLYSVGVGVRYRYRSWLGAELYWGDSLCNVNNPVDDSLQDYGIYFRVGLNLP